MSGNCEKCGTYREALHHDHKVPRWAGGGDESENRQRLCANCHEDKSRAEMRTPEFKAHMRRPKPRALSHERLRSLTARYERRHATPSGVVLRESPAYTRIQADR